MSQHYYSAKPKQPKKILRVQLKVHGMTFNFLTASGIFSKSRVDLGTRILIRHLKIPASGKVLDLGCGYGPIGIVVSKLNPDLEIHMVDVNPLAVRLARENARINNAKNVRFHVGDSLEPVKNLTFKAVYSNLPLSAGYGIIFKMIEQSYQGLEREGWLQAVIRKGVLSISNKLLSIFHNCETIAKESGYRVLLSRKI